MKNSSDDGVKIALIGLTALCFILVTVITITDRDPDIMMRFAVSTLAPLLGVVFVYRKTNDIESKTDQQTELLEKVESQTNGKLDAKFAALHDKLNEISDKENNHG